MTFIHVIVIVVVVVVADDDDDGGSETLMTTSSRGNVRNDLSEWQQRHATLVLSKIKVLFLFTVFFYFFIFTLHLLWVSLSSTMVVVLCAKEFYIICIFRQLCLIIFGMFCLV